MIITMVAGENPSLLTDLYQLTMAQDYFRERRIGRATFSLFIRSYPSNRGYFVAAGLDDVLAFLENLRFDQPALDYLASLSLFSDDFLHYLVGLRFTGEVFAIPEGRTFFVGEPILELSAPIIEAQIVETFIINQIHLQTMIATKAARAVHAAGTRPVVDFALRRTHGIDAGMKVARASYIAGFTGTSNVMAAKRYGIPPVGTMAHSFVSSFEREIDAFRAYVTAFPNSAILLIDTYDTSAGAKNAVQIAREMAQRSQKLLGVRIDSGDLKTLAVEVRRIFDAAGFKDLKIIGSGGLDEFDLEDLAGAPYDSYGVGTKMGVSADAPYADIAYKLVEFQNRPVMKLSTGKASWPGTKQIFRQKTLAGAAEKDIVGLRDEALPGEPLLKLFMREGRMTSPRAKLSEIREARAKELGSLPDEVKRIREPGRFSVEFSPRLMALRDEVARKST